MYDKSFPKEVAVKNELINEIETRFDFEFPPIYKTLILNFNTSNYNFYPTIDNLFKNSGLKLDYYMTDNEHRKFLFGSLNSPLRIYNDLISYPFATDALKKLNQLVIGNFSYGKLFVGIGENNQDAVFYHSIENGEIVPKKIEKDLYQFISKYKISLKLDSVSLLERGLLEKYWINSDMEFLLDMNKFKPNVHKEDFIKLEDLVDNIYNEIMNYVRS